MIGEIPNWRDAGYQARLGLPGMDSIISFDARLFFFLVAAALYISWTTFTAALVGIMVFRAIEMKGMSFSAALRMTRRGLSWVIGGGRRPVRAFWRNRRFLDYGA